MIVLKTKCNECVCEKVCSYKENASADMNKLKNMMYGTGPNDDYSWDIMMRHRHVDITFSCPDFIQKGVCYRELS